MISATIAALVGLVLGSALNVILYRFPRGLSMFRRLHCTQCGHPLTWEAFPLIGYLIQRGRGRHCRRPLPRYFPLVELLTAASFAVLVWRLHLGLLTGLYAWFSLTLILTLFLDWQHHYIYYIVLIPTTAVALLAHLFYPPLSVQQSLLGLGAGLAFFALLYFFGQLLFRSYALGLGDVWLAGMIGAMLGLYGAILALTAGMLLAGLAGGLMLLVRKNNPGDYLPYGAYLCLGALGYLCLGAP